MIQKFKTLEYHPEVATPVTETYSRYTVVEREYKDGVYIYKLESDDDFVVISSKLEKTALNEKECFVYMVGMIWKEENQ